jgi:hypothetical protein
MNGNMVTRHRWSCWGCDAKFWSEGFKPYVGYGPDPTDETFGHKADCKYLAVKQIIVQKLGVSLYDSTKPLSHDLETPQLPLP